MKQEQLQLTGANYRGDRRKLDLYPTPPDVTTALMDFLKLDRGCFVWEPACGDSDMVDVILSYVDKCSGTDIRNGTDYLEASIDGVGAIITNPPFFLAEKFIRKAVAESPVVAMLLKCQYWHAKCRHELFVEHPPAYVLPLTWRPDFLFKTREPGDRANPTMEVAWSVWIKGDVVTKYMPLLRPKTKPINK